MVFAERVAFEAQPALSGEDLVLVQGDTSSALGGALAGRRAGISLGHVEAGLRTHDDRNPWPEEGFRKRIDALSQLLFAPTELSAANLRREGMRGAIHVTGNTAADAVPGITARSHRERSSGKFRLLVTCHRRESWGDGLTGIADALRRIAASSFVTVDFVLHPNPNVAMRFRNLLAETPGLVLHRPQTHDEMLARMHAADLILSDSGGMQEEAPILRVPLLVLRDCTERPEAIASGNIAMVGRDPQRIVSEVMRLRGDPAALEAMRHPAQPYGDGRASERIADVISELLGANRRAAAAA
jgi:UDP-N-acetylglucosamine 2-epimerase (non-hydrolysing)